MVVSCLSGHARVLQVQSAALIMRSLQCGALAVPLSESKRQQLASSRMAVFSAGFKTCKEALEGLRQTSRNALHTRYQWYQPVNTKVNCQDLAVLRPSLTNLLFSNAPTWEFPKTGSPKTDVNILPSLHRQYYTDSQKEPPTYSVYESSASF